MSRIRVLAAAAGAVAALATVAGIAIAPAASAAPAKSTMLVLTVTEGEVASTADRMATLTCNPTGGSHPMAAQVCSALTVVQGAPQMLDADGAIMCTRIYQPVTATMFGIANGRFVDYQHTFGNACEMRAATGSLFQI